MLLKIYYRNYIKTWMADDFDEFTVNRIIKQVKKATKRVIYVKQIEGFICFSKRDYKNTSHLIYHNSRSKLVDFFSVKVIMML